MLTTDQRRRGCIRTVSMFATFAFIALGGCGEPSLSSPDASSSDLAIAVEDLATPVADLGQSSDLLPPPDLFGVACNTLNDDAPVVQQVVVNQPMPMPASGGTITPGLYYLTDSKIYQGSTMSPLQVRMTQSISPTTMDSVLNFGGPPSTGNHDTREYMTSGTTLTIHFTCGESGLATYGFDATTTQYVTYNAATKVVNTFTKQ